MRALLVLLLPLLLPLLAGCSVLLPNAQPLRLQDVELRQDTVWEGTVEITGSVKVTRGATLTLEPGTEVRFVRQDLDQDGLGDGTLVVEGALRAVGTPAAPVRFRSAAADPRPGDWLEIRVDFAEQVELRYCELRDSAYTLHAHFTRGVIADSVIHRNIDGCRLGQARFEIHHNLIADNRGKGINFRNSEVDLHHNIIRDNGAGLFIFETDRSLSVRRNNFHGNDHHVRLGDFFTGNVALGENWWGSAAPEAVAAYIYDRRVDPAIGTIDFGLASGWIVDAGPRRGIDLRLVWLVPTGGFIDAAPLVAGDLVLAASWDGRLRAVDAAGRVVWAAELGEVADAGLVADDEQVYVQDWGRRVRALSLADGRELWRFAYPESPADDHRQGGLVRTGELLLVPAWNGTLYALGAADGALRWSYAGGQSLRAAPRVSADRIYLASGSGRLSALDMSGRELWTRTLPEPLLSRPALLPGGDLAILDKAGTLHRFSAAGEPVWSRELAGPAFYAAPLVADGALFAATAAGRLYRIDPHNGEVVWSVALPGAGYATPVLSEDLLLVADNSGALSFFAPESGALLDRYEASRPLQSGPVPFGDLLVFGGRDQLLHALTVEFTTPEEAGP